MNDDGKILPESLEKVSTLKSDFFLNLHVVVT